MSDLVTLTRPTASIALLTLNRPLKKNALSIALRDAVSDALEGLREDPSLKCAVLGAAGDSFSAGFDLAEFGTAARDSAFRDQLWASSDRYHRNLVLFPLPIIAAVNGLALGGGMDTAVLCDIRIASESARFGHPEAQFGDVVYAPLHDIIGGAAARELCLAGKIIDAADALRLGLVSAVVAPTELALRASELANHIAAAPVEVLRRTKAKFIARAAIEFRSTLEL